MKESIEERRNIPLTENKLKKRAFFKPESQSCFKPDCDIRTQIGNNCKFSCEDRHSNWRDSHVFLAETVHISSCFIHESKDSV